MKLITRTESYSCNDTDFDLYVVAPQKQDSKLPAIFVAHAWDGLNTPIKESANRVAELGYVAVAVDVYGKGVRGDPLGDNSHLMNPLMDDRALLRNRLMAGYSKIKKIDIVDKARIGAIGYCFGGLCVLDLARLVPDSLKGVVSFHGALTKSDFTETEPIEAKVLIEHGWDDSVVPVDDYLAFTKEMDRRKADWQAHIHGRAMHAFTFEGANMPENGIQHNEAAAHRSWRLMVDFFDEVL